MDITEQNPFCSSQFVSDGRDERISRTERREDGLVGKLEMTITVIYS